MKTLKLKITLAVAFFGILALGRAQQIKHANINYNNVSATISNNGVLFADSTGVAGGYEFPKNSEKNLIYSSGIWLSGAKSDGTVMTAASSVPSSNRDFFPGPLGDSYTGANYMTQYDRSIWQFDQSAITKYRNWWSACSPNSPLASPAACTVLDPSQIPTNEELAAMNQWPAHGDWSNNNEAFYLAPFWNLDGMGSYDTGSGDYPWLNGCSTAYMILNDDAGIHQVSGGEKLGVEVHYQLYQFDTPGFLENTTFLRVDVINRSEIDTIYDFNLGIFIDGDLGNPNDDFIGCDTTSDMMYFYNSDNNDENAGSTLGYGINPPAFGVVSLNRQINSFVSFQSSFPTAIPTLPAQYHNFLSGLAADGSAYTDISGQATTFQFSGNPNTPGSFSETGQGNVGGDRRGLMSISIPQFGPSILGLYYSIARFDFAIVASNSGTNLQNAANLISFAEEAKDFYITGDLSCGSSILGTHELEELVFEVFPNPTKDLLTVKTSQGRKSISVVTMLGQLVKELNTEATEIQIDLNELGAGTYFVSIEKEGNKIVKLFVKEW